MTGRWWERLLRHEFTISISVRMILLIVVVVVVLGLAHTPAWLYFPAGTALGIAEDIWARRDGRRAGHD